MCWIRNFFIVLAAVIFNAQIVQADILRVTPEWLKSHLKDDNLVIIDSRPQSDYEIDHISGAVSIPDTLTYQQKSSGGRIVEADIMQDLLRKRGINYDKLIVIYDAGQLIDAARVFWTLETYGLSSVRVLSSGYDNWVRNNYPVTAEIPDVKPSDYVVSIDHRRIASKFSTQLAIANPKQITVDARGEESYKGLKSTARRFGHIPTAINIPIGLIIEERNGIKSLRGIDELMSVYSMLPHGSKIVTYCEIGRAYSAVYFALRELDYDVANYDASWREWGNDFNLPIEK